MENKEVKLELTQEQKNYYNIEINKLKKIFKNNININKLNRDDTIIINDTINNIFQTINCPNNIQSNKIFYFKQLQHTLEQSKILVIYYYYHESYEILKHFINQNDIYYDVIHKKTSYVCGKNTITSFFNKKLNNNDKIKKILLVNAFNLMNNDYGNIGVHDSEKENILCYGYDIYRFNIINDSIDNNIHYLFDIKPIQLISNQTLEGLFYYNREFKNSDIKDKIICIGDAIGINVEFQSENNDNNMVIGCCDINEEGILFQCILCLKWYHKGCLFNEMGYNEDELNTIQKKVNWYCMHCESKKRHRNRKRKKKMGGNDKKRRKLGNQKYQRINNNNNNNSDIETDNTSMEMKDKDEEIRNMNDDDDVSVYNVDSEATISENDMNMVLSDKENAHNNSSLIVSDHEMDMKDNSHNKDNNNNNNNNNNSKSSQDCDIDWLNRMKRILPKESSFIKRYSQQFSQQYGINNDTDDQNDISNNQNVKKKLFKCRFCRVYKDECLLEIRKHMLICQRKPNGYKPSFVMYIYLVYIVLILCYIDINIEKSNDDLKQDCACIIHT